MLGTLRSRSSGNLSSVCVRSGCVPQLPLRRPLGPPRHRWRAPEAVLFSRSAPLGFVAGRLVSAAGSLLNCVACVTMCLALF